VTYFTGQFPYFMVRVRAEVWPDGSKGRASHAFQSRGFLMRRLGKRLVMSPRPSNVGKAPFFIRVSVWD
jgi:hypothetical protein